MLKIPEFLYETTFIAGKKACLICGKTSASSELYSFSGKPIIPMCQDCSVKWNFHGYQVLKRIKTSSLLWNLIKFKLVRVFSGPSLWSIVTGLINFIGWSNRFRADVKNLTGKNP